MATYNNLIDFAIRSRLINQILRKPLLQIIRTTRDLEFDWRRLLNTYFSWDSFRAKFFSSTYFKSIFE
jgi:hypothetical protein